METVDVFRARAADWIASHRDHAPVDYGAICPPHLVDDAVAWHRSLVEAGFAGIHWPAEFGGAGLTPAHNAAWVEECARAGVPAMFNMVGLVLAAGAVTVFGTDDQKSRHLGATLRAEHLWCQLFSEPNAGSDLAGLSTTAVRDGDCWVVNGQKVWCSGGRYSNWGILMARTDPTARKHEGVSFFLCPMDLPGIEIRPLRQMTGGSEFDEVFFTDVALPAEHLIGPLHGGWGVGMAVLTNERGHIGASIIGMERRIDSLRRLGTEHALDDRQRHELAAMMTRAIAYRSLVQTQGPVASTASSLMKLGMTELLFDTAMFRAGAAGAAAMLEGNESAGVLAAPGGRIAGGTSQIQRNIIGERLLGLPREPR